MVLVFVLMTVMIGLVLVGFKLIWEDEPNEPTEPPSTTGHLAPG